MVSTLAITDALAKLLIAKGVITGGVQTKGAGGACGVSAHSEFHGTVLTKLLCPEGGRGWPLRELGYQANSTLQQNGAKRTGSNLLAAECLPLQNLSFLAVSVVTSHSQTPPRCDAVKETSAAIQDTRSTGSILHRRANRHSDFLDVLFPVFRMITKILLNRFVHITAVLYLGRFSICSMIRLINSSLKLPLPFIPCSEISFSALFVKRKRPVPGPRCYLPLNRAKKRRAPRIGPPLLGSRTKR